MDQAIGILYCRLDLTESQLSSVLALSQNQHPFMSPSKLIRILFSNVENLWKLKRSTNCYAFLLVIGGSWYTDVTFTLERIFQNAPECQTPKNFTSVIGSQSFVGSSNLRRSRVLLRHVQYLSFIASQLQWCPKLWSNFQGWHCSKEI